MKMRNMVRSGRLFKLASLTQGNLVAIVQKAKEKTWREMWRIYELEWFRRKEKKQQDKLPRKKNSS